MFRSRLSKFLPGCGTFDMVFSGTVLELLVDWKWFSALGHTELFSTRVTTQISLFLVSFAFAFAIIFINVQIASRSVDFDLGLLQEQMTDVQLSKDALAALFRLGGWLLALAPAALIAWAISQQWFMLSLFSIRFLLVNRIRCLEKTCHFMCVSATHYSFCCWSLSGSVGLVLAHRGYSILCA